MATYTVQYGQNLFDVALTLYGSIEGILDLLVNNKNLSINTELKYGDELEYTPYYYEDSTVVSYFKDNNIIPSNSIGNIYFETRDDLFAMSFITSTQRYFSFSISGEGAVFVDWGDGNLIEEIKLTSVQETISHTYTSDSNDKRIVKFYGSPKIYGWNLTQMNLNQMFVIKDVSIENFALEDSYISDVGFVNLIDDVLYISFANTRAQNINELIKHKRLITLNLSNCNMSQSNIDSYLISLVKNYGIRRNCIVDLSGNARPSGTYSEPATLNDPQTGMEAIYVLVNHHKESAGPWAFIVGNDEIYTTT